MGGERRLKYPVVHIRLGEEEGGTNTHYSVSLLAKGGLESAQGESYGGWDGYRGEG